MASRLLKAAPPVVDSTGATEYLLASEQAVKSDPINFGDTSPVTTFDVPAGTLVVGFIVEVVTVFDGLLPSISVGTVAVPARHIGTNEVDLKTVGFTRVVLGSFDYTTDAKLVTTIVPSGSTTGKVNIWAVYRSNSGTLG